MKIKGSFMALALSVFKRVMLEIDPQLGFYWSTDLA
jgi:hypothetical protein